MLIGDDGQKPRRNRHRSYHVSAKGGIIVVNKTAREGLFRIQRLMKARTNRLLIVRALFFGVFRRIRG